MTEIRQTGERAAVITMDDRGEEMECELRPVEPAPGGRLLSLSARLLNVRPGRPVALAVELYERDAGGREEERGLRVLLIPPHDDPEPRTVRTGGIRFVLPDGLSLAGPDGTRRFFVRLTAHYTDVDRAAACAWR